MSEMVERVAAALNRFAIYPKGHPAQYYIYDFHAFLDRVGEAATDLEWKQPSELKMIGHHDEAEAECARMNARAVIEVMLEPTDAMINHNLHDDYDPRQVWQTMVDAILAISEEKRVEPSAPKG